MSEIAKTLWMNTTITAIGGLENMPFTYWKKNTFSTYASVRQAKKTKSNAIVLFFSLKPFALLSLLK